MRWGRYNNFTTESAKEAFSNRIEVDPKSGCHIWRGAKRSDGRYGIVTIAGRFWLAHRAAWLLFVGEDPASNCVCHRCDNGMCVNPEHLFLGTQGNNVRDMESKQRSKHPSAEQHGRAKLTWLDVDSIRELYRNGMAIRAIARKYPIVSRTVVSAVIKRRIWITR